MRRSWIALLLGGCSRICGHASIEPASIEPASIEPAPDVMEAAAALDASSDVITSDGCIDVEADVRARYDAWSARQGGQPDFDAAVDDGMHVSRVEITDLDGDGVKEIVWSFAAPPVTDAQHVYRGGGCGAYLGELQGGVLNMEKTKHDGHADLTVEDYGSFCEGSACGCTPEVRHYEFSAGAYKENVPRRSPGSVTPCGDP